MKKVFLGLMSISLILGLASGCSNDKEKELCNKIDIIDVHSITDENNYEDLATVLEGHYKDYCDDSDSEVCIKLDEYIKLAKEEINLEDCSNLDDNLAYLCEKDNELAITDKKISIDYVHEEIWRICNN